MIEIFFYYSKVPQGVHLPPLEKHCSHTGRLIYLPVMSDSATVQVVWVLPWIFSRLGSYNRGLSWITCWPDSITSQQQSTKRRQQTSGPVGNNNQLSSFPGWQEAWAILSPGGHGRHTQQDLTATPSPVLRLLTFNFRVFSVTPSKNVFPKERKEKLKIRVNNS